MSKRCESDPEDGYFRLIVKTICKKFSKVNLMMNTKSEIFRLHIRRKNPFQGEQLQRPYLFSFKKITTFHFAFFGSLLASLHATFLK